MITGAELSYDDQLRIRRRRYLLMMGLRIPCLLLAVAFMHIWWLALLIILISIPLPWMAVLIANDRPSRRTRKAPVGVINHENALPGRTVELPPSAEVIDAPDPAEHRSSTAG